MLTPSEGAGCGCAALLSGVSRIESLGAPEPLWGLRGAWVQVRASASVRGCRLRLHPGLGSRSLAEHPVMLSVWDSSTHFNESEHTAAGEGAVRQSRREEGFRVGRTGS